MKRAKIVAMPRCLLVAVAASLAGCGPDYTPIGDGLKAIGICLVAYGVVHGLVELILSENQASHTPKLRRRKRLPSETEGSE
jgi:hypothetical protein